MPDGEDLGVGLERTAVPVFAAAVPLRAAYPIGCALAFKALAVHLPWRRT